MKYYIYISKVKIDMLYPQIPERQRDNLAANLGINLGVVRADWSEQPREKSLIEKTQIVREYMLNEERQKISHYDGISSSGIFEPYSYFSKIDMAISGDQDSFYAVTYSSIQDYVIHLVGSGAHILGGSNLQSYGGSHLTAVLMNMALSLKLRGGEDIEGVTNNESLIRAEMRGRAMNPDGYWDGVVERMSLAHWEATGGIGEVLPLQKLEFLGRNLLERNGHLIITPVYVSYSD